LRSLKAGRPTGLTVKVVNNTVVISGTPTNAGWYYGAYLAVMVTDATGGEHPALHVWS
jgi:hypothetical protein